MTRLAIAAVVLGAGALILWQAGIVFKSDDASITDDSGRTVELQSSDVSVETVASAGRSVGLEVGDVAPDFEFSSFEGERLRLSDFRGRPVFLNFWATWCGPCRAELPAMEVLLRDHEADRLAVIGVNNGERIQAAERFLERLDVKLTAYAYDPAASIAERYAILGMPTSYFIDSDGVITGVFATQLSPELMEEATTEAIAGYSAPAD
ncbi:MAG TPA: TlpA disulfide reductase family protein [Dehalococcoidia bacterium]|nr:TlpA disulfide reductase family protein [Dehalococcoidia bacterium]